MPDVPDRLPGRARRRVLLVEDKEAHARLASLRFAQDGHGRCEAAPAERLSDALAHLGRGHVAAWLSPGGAL